MTKREEISTLDVAIDQLGKGSYIGPWLREVRDCVQADILSDIFPTVTVTESKERAAEIIAEAQRKAAEIIAEAQAKAKQYEDHADRVRDSLAKAIRCADRALNEW